MDTEKQTDLKKEINRVVDLMVQADSIRESIAELKKDIKANYDLPVPVITKIATIIRKQSLEEEEAKWLELKEYIDMCS